MSEEKDGKIICLECKHRIEVIMPPLSEEGYLACHYPDGQVSEHMAECEDMTGLCLGSHTKSRTHRTAAKNRANGGRRRA